MSKTVIEKKAGISFLGLLGVVFIALKLAGIGEVATWSWWAVLAPIWIPWAIVVGIMALIVVGAVIVTWAEK